MTIPPVNWLSQRAKDAQKNGEYFLFGRYHHCLCGTWILDSAPTVGDVRVIHYEGCAWMQDLIREQDAAMAAFKAQRMRR